MPRELDPMTIQPASGNYGEAVISSHASLSKNGSADVPDYASNGVRGENLFF